MASTQAFLGLGSNLGDRQRLLSDGLAYIAERVELVAVSSLYCTAPIGGPADSPAFLNLVAELRVGQVSHGQTPHEQTPHELLMICQAAEKKAQRVREEVWGPRTLDVDVLLYGDLRLDDPDLIIPHPRMLERRFVMDPLAELAPELAARLLAELDLQTRAELETQRASQECRKVESVVPNASTHQ